MKILIKNIKKIHGLSNRDGQSILVNSFGIVEQIGNPPCENSCKVIDASDCEVSLGWVDVHTHLFYGISDIGLRPNEIGKCHGVNHLIDAGSAGYVNFKGFKDFIVSRSNTNVYEFLNYGAIGISRMNKICDYETNDFINPNETIKLINGNKDVIRGVKVRACKVVLKERGIEVVEGAKKVASRCGLPLMVHVGEPGPELPDIFSILDSGDIVTHTYHGKPGNILSDKKTFKSALSARSRGVLFDVGHGVASFDLNVAKKCIELGFLPDLIGSDLHVFSRKKGAIDLPSVLSKMESCGIPKDTIIDRVTNKARRVLGIMDTMDDIVGKKADFTIFKMVKQDKELEDSIGNKIICSNHFQPLYTIDGNTITSCEGEI